MGACRIAGLVALLFAAAVPQARAGETAMDQCNAAKALPADADPESRRIACEIPPKYQHDVRMAEFTGRMIRLHDTAAWLTTDALNEIKAFERVSGTGRGWLTLDDGEDIEVRYFVENDGRTEAIATAKLDVDSVKAFDARKLAPPEPVSDREQRLMRAKMLALSEGDNTLCTRHAPNTVVFELEEDGRQEILVFVMSAWDDNAAPLGGYHMYRVSRDGGTLLDHFSQTKACPMADAKSLQSTAALMVSHMTSATPTMFHVFMSLQYRKPLYVATTQNKLLWRVEKGQVFLVEQDADDRGHSGNGHSDSANGH
jgi:hypothetical protein